MPVLTPGITSFMPKKLPFTIEKNHRNVHTIRLNAKGGKSWEQWGLLTSDQHFDSVYCNRKLMKEHFDEAVRRKAFIASFGDWYDAMQGKYDPRKSYDDLRPEYKQDTYLDDIVMDSSDFLVGYRDNIAMIGVGNHESSILKRQSTHLVKRMCHDIDLPDALGGYGGWIRFMFNVTSTRRQSILLKYHHGAGGGGEVTRGTIQTNRQAVYLPDANIVVNGHTHDSFLLPIKRHRISEAGTVYEDYQHHVRVAGYKMDYRDGADGWWVERWGAPKPEGAVWMRFFSKDGKIDVEFTQALG